MRSIILLLCCLGFYAARSQPAFNRTDFPPIGSEGHYSLAACDTNFMVLMSQATGNYTHWDFSGYNINISPDSFYSGFVPFQFDNSPFNLYKYSFPTIEELGPTVDKRHFSYSLINYLDIINDTLYLCRRRDRDCFSRRVPRMAFPLNYDVTQSYETINESLFGNSLLFSKVKYDGFGRVSTPWAVYDSVCRIKMELLEERGNYPIRITAYYWIQKNSKVLIARTEILEETEDYITALYLHRSSADAIVSTPGLFAQMVKTYSFPNPVTHRLSLTLPELSHEVHIVDLFGKVQLRSPGRQMSVNVQSLTPGKYTVLVYNEKGKVIGNSIFIKL